MNAIPGRRMSVVSRLLVYFAAFVVALTVTALLLRAAEPQPQPVVPAPSAPAAAGPAGRL